MAADVALVIVNFRTPELVSRCLRAVGSPASLAEVVVVDNASGDGSVEAIAQRHPGARVVRRGVNDGFAAGVNAGFAATSSPFVLLLNPDTEPHAGAVERLAAHLRARPRAGVAAPLLVEPDGSPQPSAYRRYPNAAIVFLELCAPLGYAMAHIPALDPYRLPPASYRTGTPVAHATGAALLIRRAAYEEAGRFDEGFFLYLEETEWQGRVRSHGWTVELVPRARVTHLVRGGGEAALAPSPHYVTSAERYLALRGSSRPARLLAIRGGLLAARLGLRALALVPGRRELNLRRASAYDRLWRDGRTLDPAGESPRHGRLAS